MLFELADEVEGLEEGFFLDGQLGVEGGVLLQGGEEGGGVELAFGQVEPARALLLEFVEFEEGLVH